MIHIPPSMLPADGRFGAGPSKIRRPQVDILATHWQDVLGTSHRQRPVKEQVARVREGLRVLFELPAEYEVVLGNGGATAFWEVATFSLAERQNQHLSFGEFGSKFAAATKAAPFLTDPDVLTSEPGTAPDWRPNAAIDLYASPHNETSTGVAVPVTRPKGAAPDALTVWDGTSAAAGIAVDPRQFDVYYFSPQKAFGSDGGLWFAMLSPAALDRASRVKRSNRHIPAFLDLSIAIENSRKDQTYNTPAIATLILMAEQIDWFNAEGGLSFTTGRCAASAKLLYEWAEACDYTNPFVHEPRNRSNVTATVDLVDAIDADAVTRALRANGIVDIEPYRKLGRNQLRVGMFPAVETTDVQALTACIDFVVSKLD